jgi:hypothetical protein
MQPHSELVEGESQADAVAETGDGRPPFGWVGKEEVRSDRGEKEDAIA